MEDPFAQSWDDSLRKLVHADPQAFVHLVDPEAEYLNAYKEKLKPLTREVDGLLLTQRKDGKQQLILSLRTITHALVKRVALSYFLL